MNHRAASRSPRVVVLLSCVLFALSLPLQGEAVSPAAGPEYETENGNLACLAPFLWCGPARRASGLTELLFPSDDSTEVYVLIRRLSPAEQNGIVHFPTKEVRTDVYQRILSMARKSSNGRKTVIRALISTLQDVEHASDTRIYAADLLGKLRAVEGVDAMVANLDLKGSFSSLSLNSRPMVSAVVQIGERAISRLEQALHENGQAIRAEASVALGFIGGKRAKRALDGALQIETDEKVRAYLRGALSEIALRSNRNPKSR